MSRRSAAIPGAHKPEPMETRPARRRWAADGGGLIVEDDYDAEFRYDRSPVGALQGFDPGRVVHVGTASKTLAPGVRLGWMSLPGDLVDAVRASKAAADSGSPTVDQLALANLLSTGEYDRQVGRARHVYRRRRDELVAALAVRLPRLHVEGVAAGLHVLLRLPDRVDDVALACEAAGRGIGVRALFPMQLAGGPQRGPLLGYGRLTVDRIDDAVEALAAVVGPGAG